MDFGTTYLVLAIVFGLFMAWGIGANDVANAMATSVGSKAITIKQAVIIAAIFEFTGAVLAGGQVTSTIRKGIVDVSSIVNTPELLIFGMLASLLAAGIWLLIASRAGWPVSTTHSIVGSIVGFAIVGIGVDAVHWNKVGLIVMSWVVSPLLAGIIAYALFRSVQFIILDTKNPIASAKRYVPFYIFLVGFVVSLVTLLKGLKHTQLDLSPNASYGISVLCGILLMGLGTLLVRSVKFDPTADRDFHYTNVEKIFSTLMIITACTMAFAHGSNDVANAIGPLAAIVSIVQNDGQFGSKAVLPYWILLVGGAGIVLGLLMYGRRVIETVGHGITYLTPSRGFCCELAAATTVVIASGTGLPISTTHTLVGAILGVGMARGVSAIDLGIVRTIFMSWLVTLPVGGVLAIFFFFTFKGIFT